MAFSNHRLHFIALALLLCMLLASACTPQDAPAATVTFTPTLIPISSAEISNPGRGLHRWNGEAYVDGPMSQSYRRIEWSKVEGKKGKYDFSKYERDVDEAEAQHMRMILGLPQPSGPSADGGSWVPKYLTSDKLGVTARDTYYPNFNNPIVLERWKALIDAIATRYADDERVSGIQLCIVGAYGEWYFDRRVPEEAIPTEATWKAMIDYVIAEFPNKQLYMMVSSTLPEATIYALQRSPRIGWSRMALGHPQFDETFEEKYKPQPEWWDLLSNRWKTAPIITETYGTDDTDQFTLTLRQVQQYHVSLVGNGNFSGSLYSSNEFNPEKWTQDQISAFQLVGKSAGFRYQLASLTLGPLKPGAEFTLTTNWANEGNAPVYEPWRVQMQLLSRTGEVAFTDTLKGDLRTVLPTGDTPVQWKDTFTLPQSLLPGVYRVRIFIPALNDYVSPLQLAIEGQQSDGSYEVGEVIVGRT